MSRQLTSRLIPCIYILSEVWLHISSICLIHFAFYQWFLHPGPDLENSLVSSCSSCKQVYQCQLSPVVWVGTQPPWLPFNPHFGATKPLLTQPFSISCFNHIFQYPKCIKIRSPNVYHPVQLIAILQAPGHLCQESGFISARHTWFFGRQAPLSKGNTYILTLSLRSLKWTIAQLFSRYLFYLVLQTIFSIISFSLM